MLCINQVIIDRIPGPAEGTRRYWAAERPAHRAPRTAVREVAAAQVGELTDREVLIAGATAYWCEGAKSKPHRRSDRGAAR